MPKDIRWYYLAEIGFYVYLLTTESIEPKRWNFLEQFIHHMVTLALLIASFCLHLHRSGSIIILLFNAYPVFLMVSGLSCVP